MADCIWIQGSALMEAHPVGSRWAMKARERGAKIIHVDPHFSRTSAAADLYVPIRAGTDIAFLGGLIHHILETESYFRDYVVHYTNASMILREDFKDTEDLGGLFSGFDPETGVYDRTTWMFEGGDPDKPASDEHHSTQAFTDRTEAGVEGSEIPRDPTLEHPRCVFQVLKRHYRRYTPEMVERICGTPKEKFLEVAETLVANSGRERTTMLAYAVGWTQHTAGVQIIRAGTIVQLAARQRRAPGRRDHGDARPRVDPGLERHPHALRDPPGLPADASCPGGGRHARVLRRGLGPQEGLVGPLRRVHRLVAEGLVRRGLRRRRTTSASAICRS
jgi:formate dehydrogenase major subunit